MHMRVLRGVACFLGLVCCGQVAGAGPSGEIIRTLPGLIGPTATPGGWPEIPAATWDLKPSDFPDQPGAVVLVDRYHFHRRSLERFRRLLVLVDSGKATTDFQLIETNVTKLEGRTVTPEGKVIPFTQGADVLKSVLVATRRESLSALKVIPPGVTGHCVVDVRWTEPIDAQERPIPDGYDLNMVVSFSTTVPVKLAEFIFDWDLADFEWVRKFEVQAGQKFREAPGPENRKIFRFEDIPARQDIPLASQGDLQLPVLNWYWFPQVRNWLTYLGFPSEKSITSGDAAACTIFYAFLVERAGVDWHLLEQLKELGEGMDSLSTREKVMGILRALRAKVKTVAELQERPTAKELKANCSAAFKRGWGTSEQLTILGFHALKENGLPAAMVLTLDREEGRPRDPDNVWQYDNMLLALRGENGTEVFLNPGSASDPFGIPAWLQGSKALFIRPGKKRIDWRATLQSIPAVSPEENRQVWKAVITPSEETDNYDVRLEAAGNAAAGWRRQLREQQTPDALKALGPLFDRAGFRVHSASSQDLLDPWKNLAFHFTGSLEQEARRTRLISPFPFLREPFPIPRSWPGERTLTIHLPMKTDIEAEARIRWNGNPPDIGELTPVRHQNTFGKVSWSAAWEEGQDGKVLVVKLGIKVNLIVAPPALYADLKAFSGWVQEALSLAVPIPRS
jgi:hypothetical protein